MTFLRAIPALAIAVAATPLVADPLPSWNETPARAAIVAFVDSVTDPAAPTYVPPADRIAVFDNDGTLWAEQPVYFQLFFALDRLKAMAAADPSILTSDSLKAAAQGDLGPLMAGGEQALLELVMVTHSGLSVDAFEAEVAGWIATAKHPTTGLRFDQMTYQPMLELLAYLRAEDFETYIVSGGGIDFMRAFTDRVYGIPPENVVGSSGKTSYEVVDGVPTIMKDPALLFIDDKAGKPIGIETHIGKRPIFVAGNSDGDFEMLEWSTAGEGPRFGMIVHHTDAAREWAYDRDSHIGRLAKALDEAPAKGWLVVDMAKDWRIVWPEK
jgi:phosphoglycolate phosphatase-like HAD superfamily hydrolase